MDFDLHGLVRVRLVDADSAEQAAVARQLGPLQAPQGGRPDLVIRFVDRLEVGTPITCLGAGEAGFTDQAFLVLRGKQKSSARVAIPLDRLGGPCEIVCQRPVQAVPLLIAALNLRALAKGALPLHASAFRYLGQDILVTGWSKGGKTEALLGFAAQGAEYIGDEWVYLEAGGSRMFGVPEPVRLWDWHVRSMPTYRKRLGRRARFRLASLRLAGRLLESMAAVSGPGAPLVRRAASVMHWQQHVDLPPQRIFGGQVPKRVGRLDRIFFVAAHDSDQITIRPMSGEQVAQRMVFSLCEEQTPLRSMYYKFRFAFPDRRNPWIEQLEALQRRRLLELLSGREVLAVYHPYPVCPTALFQTMRRCLESTTRESVPAMVAS